MSDSDSRPSSKDGLDLGVLTIASNTLLQLGTLPLLAALVAGKALTPAIKAISTGSEEVFRGDRLPILPFPEKNAQN
ncbi:MAG: hypothetical protein KME01_03910 [Chroococcus sp. CMT-3BRIN-NPC107]|jgi:hypothetical protein|nr:hypothetical protein [Chroococcus sp. CMT-3BRIN-NPC107]